nr:hypothetical protein [Tanacetum cinerariifolium]
MQASLQGKDNVIRQLKKELSQLQVTHLQAQNDLFRAENDKVKQHYKQLKAKVQPSGLTQTKHAVDVELIVPRLRNNRDAHLDYLRHLKESMETIRNIVKEAKVVKPLDRSIVSVCRYIKHSQKLLEYAIGTCPHGSQPLTSQKIDVPVPPSSGVDSCPITGGSQPMSHVKLVRIAPAKGDTKLQIDDQPRKNKSHLRTSTHIDSRSRLKSTSAMATPSSHYNYSVEQKVKQVWKPKHVRQVWKLTSKVLTTIGHQWRPTGRIFDLGNQCSLTKFTPPKVVYSTQHMKRTSPCANQKEPNQNWGSNLSNSPSLFGFKCRSYRSSFDMRIQAAQNS